MGEFAASIKRLKTKCPPNPRPGALPLDPAVISSRSARSPWCPLPNPQYATDLERLRLGKCVNVKLSFKMNSYRYTWV